MSRQMAKAEEWIVFRISVFCGSAARVWKSCEGGEDRTSYVKGKWDLACGVPSPRCRGWKR